MTTQTLTSIGHALFDGIEAHDLSRWEALLADNFVASYPGFRPHFNMVLNKEQAKGFNSVFIEAFPDLHFEYHRTITDGQTIVYFWSGTGTNDGPLTLPSGAIPPTHKRATVAGVLVVEFSDGKIVREETYWDQVELLAQLGLMPAS